MALQLNDGRYGLRQVISPNKTVLLMKLTDTALRILENFQDRSNNTRLQPCIQFRGTQGVIQIPVSSGGGEPEYQSFTFQVSNLTQSAGVDCLQQIRSGHTGRIDCLGSVQQKVTVNATDDSFNMTRNRMTLAKEEEQKISGGSSIMAVELQSLQTHTASTKVIKQPSSSKLGKFAKRNQKHRRIVEKQQNSSSSKLSPESLASTPPLPRPNPTLLSSNRSSSPLINFNKDSTSSPPGGHGTVRNKTKPCMSISSSTTTSSFQPSQQPQLSAVASRPLWDRVAHLLIIRPYKYPEIVLRLARDGAPDKTRLQTILQQIASPRNTPNGNTEFCLQRNFYNKLDIDWPGYTESEKKSVKKKLAEANRSATESRKRAYNPGTTSPNSRDSSLDNGNGQSYLNPTSKKQRVSHYKKPSPGRPGTAPSGGGASPMETETATVISPVPASSGISFGTTKLPTREPSPIVSGQDNQTKKQQRNSGTDLQDQSSVVEKIPQDNQYSKSNKTNHGNKISQEKHEKTTENNESQNVKQDYNCREDFMLKYPPISNSAERDRYKSDFYAEYQEYLCQHAKVAAVSERFAKLQVKLSAHKKGSDEYKAISRVVVQEYRKIQKNQVYHQDKARMQFLHRKLQHIKHLVNEYDKRRLTNRAAENDPGLCMQTKTATRVA